MLPLSVFKNSTIYFISLCITTIYMYVSVNVYFILAGLHWVLMTTWVLLQKTDFCPTRWEEMLFNGVVGVIYCFCFFSLKEGATRWRMSAFYSIMFVENLILVGVWFPFCAADNWRNWALLAIVFAGFILGKTHCWLGLVTISIRDGILFYEKGSVFLVNCSFLYFGDRVQILSQNPSSPTL